MFQPQTIVPRWYQQEAIDAVYNYFLGHSGNPLIGLPGGTGKSIIPAIFITNVMKHWSNQRFLMITTVKELIEQNAEKLLTVWPNAPLGIYSAGLKRKQAYMPIVYGGLQSMIKNPSIFGFRDLIFIDEAHLVGQDESSMYLTFIATMKLLNPAVKVVGMTATPYRMGQGLLIDNGLFTHMCYDMTDTDGFNRLLAEGYMAPLIPKRTKMELDISEVGMLKGDYIGSQLQSAVDKQEITFKALRETVEIGRDRKSWLIFASGIEHAEHIAEMLTSFGVDCAPVHSKRTSEYNDQAIRAFKNNSLRSIVNYGKLTVGFDHPPIDLISDLRPTLSIPLHIQKYCRGTRPSKETQKENCVVLDFARNTQRLGCINAPIIPNKKSNKPGDIPVKICEACGTYNHTKVRYCTNCGNEFSFAVKIVAKAGTEEIIRSDLPVVEYFDVDHAIYAKKQKEGKQPYIRASYFCGLRKFDEFVFIEGSKYSKHLAKNWWQQRMPTECPQTVDEALTHISNFRTPKKIRVWINKKYPEIMGAEF